MRTIRIFLVSLAGGLAAQATDIASPHSPYTAIASRNAFSLAPIVPPKPPDPAPVEQPPKLLPSGIIDIFGRPQVLFKVVAAQKSPGVQTTSVSFLLSEGEQQENVKVLQIDRQAGTVTFNNHGTIQQLPLAGLSPGANVNQPPAPARIPFNLSDRAG